MKISNIKSDCEMSFDKEEVKKSLILENDFLIKLVDTIPAKMYFDSEIQEKLTAEKHLSMDRTVEGNFVSEVIMFIGLTKSNKLLFLY